MEEKLVIKVRSFVGSAAAILVLAMAAPAYAQQAPVEGYGGQAGVTESQTGSGEVAGERAQSAPVANGEAERVASAEAGSDATLAVAAEGGRLPFTGLDLTLVLSAGLALLALGFGMRRLTGGPNTA